MIITGLVLGRVAALKQGVIPALGVIVLIIGLLS